MKLTLHHVNFATDKVNEMDAFYKDMYSDLTRKPGACQYLKKTRAIPATLHSGPMAIIQFHLARKDLEVGFRTGHAVNPVERGHIAFRTDDIQAFRKHLEENGISYSDWGNTAVQGWHQIFFYDPDGNVIEVHQVEED